MNDFHGHFYDVEVYLTNSLTILGCYNTIQSKPQADREKLCPFCSQANLHVVYDSTSSSSTSSSASRPISTPAISKAVDSQQPIKTAKIPIEKRVTVPTASVNDRKSIEEQILKNQRIFREEISSSSSMYSRSYEQYRSPFQRRYQQQSRLRGSSQGGDSSISTGEEAVSNSHVSSSLSSAYPGQSLADRLERLFLYYNGSQQDEAGDENDFNTNDLIMSLSDIASASSRRSATTNDSSRLRTTSDYEQRSMSQSSVTSSQRSYEAPVDSIIESVFGGQAENAHTLEELEEMMILEVSYRPWSLYHDFELNWI
jgi:hypothetical protein